MRDGIWRTVGEAQVSMVQLERSVEKVEDAINLMDRWSCPKHLKPAWGQLEEFLTSGEDGPVAKLRRMQEELEDAADEEKDDDDFAFSISFCISGAHDGFDEMLDVMQAWAYAEAREEYNSSQTRRMASQPMYE